MTCREELRKQYPDYESLLDHIIATDCPEDHMNIEEPNYCQPFSEMCEKCWDREIPPTMVGLDLQPDDPMIIPTAPQILDSGDRTQFESGAVRDMREGKGRCDLAPLEVVSKLIDPDGDTILDCIRDFQKTRDCRHLYDALNTFTAAFNNQMETLILEVAKHFEEGAKKYGENNWQKGIPVHCYIDSAVRHYLKWLRGDKDEYHCRAFCWNLMCCIWEVDYHKTTVEGAENNETC